MKIRALIVDDEPLARLGLRKILKSEGDILVIGECANGREAISAVRQLSPDLVFLDIHMPEMSGLEVAESIGPDTPPFVIFITGFDEHAVHAFQVQALDYVLKPIDENRLQVALEHARAAISRERAGTYGRNVAAAFASLDRPGEVAALGWPSNRIPISTDDRILLVRIPDIDWVEAAGNYVTLHVNKSSWLLRQTIALLEERLVPMGFARIHRSTLVNIERIVELRPVRSGDFSVLLKDGTILRMSRYYRPALSKPFGTLGVDR